MFDELATDLCGADYVGQILFTRGLDLGISRFFNSNVRLLFQSILCNKISNDSSSISIQMAIFDNTTESTIIHIIESGEISEFGFILYPSLPILYLSSLPIQPRPWKDFQEFGKMKLPFEKNLIFGFEAPSDWIFLFQDQLFIVNKKQYIADSATSPRSFQVYIDYFDFTHSILVFKNGDHIRYAKFNGEGNQGTFLVKIFFNLFLLFSIMGNTSIQSNNRGERISPHHRLHSIWVHL